MTHFAPV